MVPSRSPLVGDDRRGLQRGEGAEPWPPTVLERSIPERFAEIVERFGDRPAVVDGGVVISYAGLDRRTSRIASAATDAAREAGVPLAGGRVALLLPQGSGLVAGIVASLRAGACYVPLDPTDPEALLVSRLDHAEVALVLADAGHAALARRVAGRRPVVDIDASGASADADGPEPTCEPALPSIDPDSPATLYYTSGSTGRPKAVLDTHRNVVHNVRRYAESLAIGPGDRLTLIHPPTFSGIVSSLFAGLLGGAAVLPFDLRRDGLDGLAAWLVHERATMLHCVPMVARGVFRGDAWFPDLRVVRLEGDLATWEDVKAFRRHVGRGAVLVNGLGATETGLTRQFFVGHDSPTGTGRLPIGYPVPEVSIRVVDERGRPVAPGHAGEILVASRHLAVGYWRDTERTAAAFGVDPDDATLRTYRTGDLGRLDPDERLHHLGRLDDVAKVNGMTVDPGAVEAVLDANPDVRASVAVTRPGPDGAMRLVAYVVPAVTNAVIDVTALRHALADQLPAGLVPSAIVAIPAIPVTVAGKVDRAALPAPGQARPPLDSTYRAASDPLETALVATWEAVVGVRPVGVDDDFFELGGDSFGALRMLLEVGETRGRVLAPEVLVRSPTVAALADALRSAGGSTGDPGMVRLADGPGPPLFAIHAAVDRPWLFRELARSGEARRTVYSLGTDPMPGHLREQESIGHVADRHLARIRSIQPTGPYHLAGFCYGGLIAFEIAHRLEADGERVAQLALLAVTPLEFPSLVSADARRRYRRSVLRERIRFFERTRRGSGVIGMSRVVAGRASVRATALAYRLRSRRASDRDGPQDADAPDLRTARSAEIAAYRARPFPGRVLVVVARDARPRFVHDPHRDFAGLSATGVDIVVLPGDDHAMLAAPLAATLATRLAPPGTVR